MKKLFLTLTIILFLTTPQIILAQEADPTTSPSANQLPESDEEIERVQRIKDIVASKVAELNLVEKKGIIATVTDTTNTEIKGVDIKGENVEISVDELTEFDFEDEDFGISDLENGTVYSFIGLYNKDTETLLARFISEPNSIPNYTEGAISEINEDDFQITVMNAKGESFSVDIEKSTDTAIIDDKGSLEESGFSDLEIEQRIIVVGFITDEKNISASRIIHFQKIPPTIEVLSKLKTESNIASGSANSLEIMELQEEE